MFLSSVVVLAGAAVDYNLVPDRAICLSRAYAVFDYGNKLLAKKEKAEVVSLEETLAHISGRRDAESGSGFDLPSMTLSPGHYMAEWPICRRHYGCCAACWRVCPAHDSWLFFSHFRSCQFRPSVLECSDHGDRKRH